MALIELKELSRVYGFGGAATIALNEADLSIESGEFVAVMGPSGSGKSTLMNIIGLLDRASQGKFMLNGRDVTRLSSNKRAKRRLSDIGFIYQSYNLLPRLTALENVALPLAYKGVSQPRRLKLASGMLERVGLGDREYFYPSQLSGGQAQCVAIARALINDPNIIIADEPTGNLDSSNSRLIMELLSEIHGSGNTIIFVTHNHELTRYATRVLYMNDGEIAFDDPNRLGHVASRVSVESDKPVDDIQDNDLAGVSVLMKNIPGSTKSQPNRKRRPASKKKTTSKKGKKK